MSDAADNPDETAPPLTGSAAHFAPAAAPSGEDFLAIAADAFAGLPQEFRALCANVVIQVTDFADESTLAHFKMENPYELTGLYHGVDLTQKSIADPHDGPDYVFLYRLPILLEWCERGDVTLRELIAHVLVHEIGHHFGLSDDDMHAIEDAAD
ncbi:MAG: metallopeptidase family protein [Oceanicaulis sp.]|nr:metallopeptidase family protein [Oceanicaulis sp.]